MFVRDLYPVLGTRYGAENRLRRTSERNLPHGGRRIFFGPGDRTGRAGERGARRKISKLPHRVGQSVAGLSENECSAGAREKGPPRSKVQCHAVAVAGGKNGVAAGSDDATGKRWFACAAI